MEHGVNPEPLFNEVAALSSSEVNEGREFSTQEFLKNFDPAKFSS